MGTDTLSRRSDVYRSQTRTSSVMGKAFWCTKSWHALCPYTRNRMQRQRLAGIGAGGFVPLSQREAPWTKCSREAVGIVMESAPAPPVLAFRLRAHRRGLDSIEDVRLLQRSSACFDPRGDER